MVETPLVTAQQIRQIILEQSKRAHVGHIGCSLSVADVVGALYGGAIRIPHPDHADRDRFVLSKGHAALAIYAALFLKGWITEETLNTYCGDGSFLGVHPEHRLAGVDFSTGSLGQGLSFGVGAALAARIQRSARRVFVLASDAECNEGALWEAVMFAAHHRLANLTAIIDLNGQQALGYTESVMNLRPMHERWRAFGWDVREVDGHDADQLAHTLTAIAPDNEDGANAPHVVLARTTFGKGVSFMESQIKWHYLPMSDNEYRQACEQVGARVAQ